MPSAGCLFSVVFTFVVDVTLTFVLVLLGVPYFGLLSSISLLGLVDVFPTIGSMAPLNC